MPYLKIILPIFLFERKIVGYKWFPWRKVVKSFQLSVLDCIVKFIFNLKTLIALLWIFVLHHAIIELIYNDFLFWWRMLWLIMVILMTILEYSQIINFLIISICSDYFHPIEFYDIVIKVVLTLILIVEWLL